jgi:hypothetical protein
MLALCPFANEKAAGRTELSRKIMMHEVVTNTGFRIVGWLCAKVSYIAVRHDFGF